MRWWLLLLTSCATAKPPPPPPPPPPPKARANAVRLRVAPLDVSVCAKPDAVAPLTRETLSALLELERSRFEPCVTDTADGGVLVELTAGPAGLTPKSQDPCLSGAAAGLQLTAPQPVTASLTLAPGPERGPEAVPEAWALREAVSRACTCFEGLGVNSPPQLLLIHKPGAPVDIVTAEDPLAAKVERCLEEQLAAQPAPSLEVTIDLPLLNADASADAAKDVSPQVDEAQRLASQRRARARLVLLEARRAALLARLTPLVGPLKRKPTPKLMRERSQWCALLLEVDEALEAIGPAPMTDGAVDPCAGARPAE